MADTTRFARFPKKLRSPGVLSSFRIDHGNLLETRMEIAANDFSWSSVLRVLVVLSGPCRVIQSSQRAHTAKGQNGKSAGAIAQKYVVVITVAFFPNLCESCRMRESMKRK